MTQNKPAPKVIVIPAKEESAQELEKKKNLRVAAYCRVSTNSEEQLNSYENQKAYYRYAADFPRTAAQTGAVRSDQNEKQ